MNVYGILTVAVLALHLVWILWVLLGWLGTRRRPLVRWLHLGSLVYSILIEVLLWPCPLTLAEQWLRQRAGWPTYGQSFLIHYLEAVIYPDVSQVALTIGAVAVCGGIFGVHLWRFAHRTPEGW